VEERKSVAPTEVRTPNHPSRRIVDVLTTLSLPHKSLVLASVLGGITRLHGAWGQ
jgi:hypothetical protein